MAKPKRRRGKTRSRKSDSVLGLFALEAIAVVAFFMLFTQAKSYREANAPMSVDQIQASDSTTFETYDHRPLRDVLFGTHIES